MSKEQKFPESVIDPIGSLIYSAYEADSEDLPRLHLGPSQIGKECDRAIWLDFRWANTGQRFDGRMLRLLKRGSKEEAWVVADLERIGCVVHQLTEDGKQYSFNEGHFQGSVDGVIENLPGAEKTPHLLEIKTHNDKSFNWVKDKGVRKGKPEHYAQMQVYMQKLELTRALYFAVNKNNDEIYCERIHLIELVAEHYSERALKIIDAVSPPPRLESRSGFACTYCHHKENCLGSQLPQINCRTCTHSTPVEDGKWHCEKKKIFLPESTQRFGCEEHLFHPQLMPESWKLINVTYDGSYYEDNQSGERFYNPKGGPVVGA